MSKFKASTHQQIDQTIKELLRPAIEAGKTYIFASKYGVVKRQVVEVGKTELTYLKNGDPIKCQVKSFQRMNEQHGVEDGV